jgi:RimJ/RimL family protein N-acetyltransferase
MRLVTGMVIEAVGESDWDEFFRYLNDHCSDNGTVETGYFIPLPHSQSRFPPDKERSFRDGLKLPIDSVGWRRAWVARTADGRIAGHIDLRSHPMPFTGHRCLLGMGVHRQHRRLGLAGALLSHANQWALAETALEWIDLHVLSANERAIRLYQRAGFEKVGEMPEMFKFDGRAFSDLMMTKHIRKEAGGTC